MISASAALTGSYDYGEVARSVLIAIFASYAALDLSGRLNAARGRVRLAWLSGGAIAMGIGMWEMHFKGILAFHLPVPVEYHWPTVLASLLVAVLASAVALYVSSRHKMGSVEALTGSIFMGAGIAGMHYIGMAAMRLPAITRYSPFLVTCSILLAILFSLVALFMAFGLREETRWSVLRRLGSATVMGVAVSAMHYTGMAAATFIPASAPDLSHAVSIPEVGNFGVVLVALIVLVAAATTSSVDRRRSEDRLRLVIDTIPQQIWSTPPDGLLDFCNAQFRSYVGLTLEELQGKGWQHVLHPDDLERALKVWRDSVMNGITFEQEVRRRGADGLYRWFLVRGVPLKDSEGCIVRWYGTSTDIEDRKRAEEELRKQKEDFQKIFENIPVLIAFRGKDRKLQLVNPEWERTTGWKLEEIREQNLDILAEFFPDPHYRQVIRDLIAVSTGLWNDIQLRARDGRVIDLASTFVHLSDGSTLFIARDITERKRAEEELRKQKEVFQTVFENIPVMIGFLGKHGHFDFVNPEWERTTGWTLQEIRQPNFDAYAELFPDPQYRQMVGNVVAASAGQWTDLKVRTRDGRVIDVSSNLVRLSDGSTLGIGRDVSERKRAEAELRESEARFRLVADSAPVMIWMSGTDKLCTYFNKPWLDFTGRSLDRELGNGWAEGVDPEDLQKCLDTYIQSFDRREAFRMEYRLRRHDGEFRQLFDIGVPRFNPDRSFAGYIGSCIDVTETRGAEEQLRHAQEDLARVTRVVSMGELAAAIAHEVNQPLTAIVTNGQFCLRELDGAASNPDELRAAIGEIVNDGTRASAVISRIRGLLTKEVPDRKELDINQIIQNVTILLRHEFTRHRVSLRHELASDLPRVPGDPVQLQQVLINLIMNAIEATSSSTNGRRKVLIRSAQKADGVVVQVQDSGLGVEPGLANRVFEPFFTTKAKGIGMGLSISHSIIESHGGRLGIAPSSTGALFEFTLPID